MAIFWWMDDHYFKMAAWMYRCWMKTFFSDSFFFFKRHVLLEMRQVLYFYANFHKFFYTETVGSLTSSDRDSLHVARRQMEAT